MKEGKYDFIPLAPMFKAIELAVHEGMDLNPYIERMQLKIAETQTKKGRKMLELCATDFINTMLGSQNRDGKKQKIWDDHVFSDGSDLSDSEIENTRDDIDSRFMDGDDIFDDDDVISSYICVVFQPETDHDPTQIQTLFTAGLLDIKVSRELIAKKLNVDPALQKEFMIEKEDKEKEGKDGKKGGGGSGGGKRDGKKKPKGKIVISIESGEE